jgi:hypothetical protein
MVGFIIGGILIVLGILLALLVPMKLKNKNIEIKFMQTTPIAELKKILSGNAAAGLDGYRHYVELKALADSDAPQKTPFSEKEVAYYSADLYQVVEEMQTIKTEKGSEQRINKSESLVSNQKSTGPMALRDPQSQDKVYIDTTQSGLRLDTVKTLDQFEPAGNMGKYSFFNRQQLKIMGTGARTLGYRMVENVIPIGQSLYVLGDALLEGAKISILRPKDKKPFMVSTKGKDDIVRSNQSGAKVALVFGILLVVGGVLVMAFVR